MRAEVPLFGDFYSVAASEYAAAEPRLLANEALKRMLNSLVTDLMRTLAEETRALGATTLADVRNAPARLARLSPPMEARRSVAKAYLYRSLYESPTMVAEHAHAGEVIQTLFSAWVADPERLPEDHQQRAREEGAPRAVAD